MNSCKTKDKRTGLTYHKKLVECQFLSFEAFRKIQMEISPSLL